eukprot:scaffold83069_cov22-Cyclotella_meneghiniana.AAC.1
MSKAAPLIPPRPAHDVPWKLRHSGVLAMCARGCDKHGRLNKALLQAICEKYNYRRPGSIREIWKKYKESFLSGDGFRVNRSGTSGRKHKYTADGLVQAIRNVPLVKRRTLRSLSYHANIPRLTLHNYLRRGLLKRATSSIKPALKQANIQRRLNYCRAKVEADGNFNDLLYDVHVDEKWFFVQQIDEKYYLLPDEDVDLYRSCKHKSHIEKVMFGAAVARPRTNPLTGEVWDGKIHLHPFVEYAYAQRSSVNRPAGTRITKPRSINKEVYREWLCEYVVHAIVAQWPDWCEKRAQIQQDNATPHINPTDERWLEVTNFYRQPENGGWNITLSFQPPNSPDLNICDLAQFRAMQSLQQQHVTKNVDELITIVKNCWRDFPIPTSKKIWSSLQLIYNEVINADGAAATTEDAATDSPTGVEAVAAGQTQELTDALHQLSLQVTAEEGIAWETLLDEIDWEDRGGHDEPAVDDSGAVEGLDGLEEAAA